MAHLVVTLPENRDQTGTLSLQDDSGHTLAGPFTAYGRSDHGWAAANGNPSHDPALPWGDFPSGTFRVDGARASNGENGHTVSTYGPAGALHLVGTSGDAAHRSNIEIHAGDLQNGHLRPTHGCLRLSNEDMTSLMGAMHDHHISPSQLSVTSTNGQSVAAPHTAPHAGHTAHVAHTAPHTTPHATHTDHHDSTHAVAGHHDATHHEATHHNAYHAPVHHTETHTTSHAPTHHHTPTHHDAAHRAPAHSDHPQLDPDLAGHDHELTSQHAALTHAFDSQPGLRGVASDYHAQIKDATETAQAGHDLGLDHATVQSMYRDQVRTAQTDAREAIGSRASMHSMQTAFLTQGAHVDNSQGVAMHS